MVSWSLKSKYILLSVLLQLCRHLQNGCCGLAPSQPCKPQSHLYLILPQGYPATEGLHIMEWKGNPKYENKLKTNFRELQLGKWLWFSLRTACSLAVICCRKINFLTSCVIVLKTVICGQNLWKQDVVNSSSLKKYQRKVKFWEMRCLAGSAGRNYIFSKNVYNKCWNSEIERSVSKKV